MRQIVYAMQFKGQAGPSEKAGTMVAKTASDSCRITSAVTGAGLEGKLERAEGGRATFESTVTITGDTSFLEAEAVDKLSFREENERILKRKSKPATNDGVRWTRTSCGPSSD